MSPLRRRLGAYVRLGRVSNLPTVWTNAVAGAALATWGQSPPGTSVLVHLAVVFSVFYVAGMFLNDACDARFDAVARPERPIPSGLVTAEHVERVAHGMLAAGIVALALGFGLPAALGGGALAAAIVVYDVRHKGNPLAPIVMGACRALVHVTAALALTGRTDRPVVLGASALLLYVTSLTFVARRAGGAVVGAMIAGIALLDAAIVALAWSPTAGLVVALGFPLTLRLQRRVAGT